MSRKIDLGRLGEDLAVAFLNERGVEILERNWRCDRGEIDIIALDRNTLAAIEVKTRRSLRFGHPLEAITDAKMSRLRTLAVLWARANDYYDRPLRVDAVSVLLEDLDYPRIEHLRGVYR